MVSPVSQDLLPAQLMRLLDQNFGSKTDNYPSSNVANLTFLLVTNVKFSGKQLVFSQLCGFQQVCKDVKSYRVFPFYHYFWAFPRQKEAQNRDFVGFGEKPRYAEGD